MTAKEMIDSLKSVNPSSIVKFFNLIDKDQIEILEMDKFNLSSTYTIIFLKPQKDKSKRII